MLCATLAKSSFAVRFATKGTEEVFVDIDLFLPPPLNNYIHE
jgi:hypothetical protein